MSHPNLPRVVTADRRRFLQHSTTALAGATLIPSLARAGDRTAGSPETLVKTLYDSLSEAQRPDICFDWDHRDPQLGLLRTRVSANWQITKHDIRSDFFTDDQQDLIRQIFQGIVNSEWHGKFDKQMEDDCGGFGHEQAIALFGTPGEGKFEFVITGRHMTLRCDGDTAEHVAFGGPIFYGHAPTGDELPDHRGNVFWHQALEANKVYQMLDGKQRKLSEVSTSPRESRVGFQGSDGLYPGIPVTELSRDQREQLQKTLKSLVEPFREADRQEAMQCLDSQGGLDACSLAFFTDHDLGDDQVWDNWRLEGPSFVWHFRGAPHVHVWVNVADQPHVELNA